MDSARKWSHLVTRITTVQFSYRSDAASYVITTQLCYVHNTYITCYLFSDNQLGNHIHLSFLLLSTNHFPHQQSYIHLTMTAWMMRRDSSLPRWSMSTSSSSLVSWRRHQKSSRDCSEQMRCSSCDAAVCDAMRLFSRSSWVIDINISISFSTDDASNSCTQRSKHLT